LLSASLPLLDKVAALIEQEESRRSVIGVPQARKNEGAEAQALAVRGFRNPNLRKKSRWERRNVPIARKEDTVRRLAGSYTHISARRLGSTKEIKGERGRMSGIREHNDEKKRRQRRVSRQGGFSTLRVFDPVVIESEDSNSHRSSGSINGSGAEDQMQRMFKSFSTWYAQQNSDGLSLNSFKPNLHILQPIK
jgi:hypothetical protein